MRYLSTILLLLVGLNALFAQKFIDIDKYSAVKANGKFELRLLSGEKESVAIKSGKADLSMLSYEIKEGELQLKTLSTFPKDGSVVVELTYVDIERFVTGKGIKLYNRDTLFTDVFEVKTISGGEVDLVLNCDTVIAKVNKGGFVRLNGKATHVDLRTATGGDYRATELQVKTMNAKLSGGSAEVNVDEFIEVNATMKGYFYYKEQPKKIKKKASTGGRVGLLDDF